MAWICTDWVVDWDGLAAVGTLLAVLVAIAFGVPSALCQTALLSAGAVALIARVTIFSTLQKLVFVALGASQGLETLGFALIGSAAVSCIIWLRATARHIDMPWVAMLHTLRQSAKVAACASIGPAIAFAVYGPYPEGFLRPLLIGCFGSLIGLVSAVLYFRHPLQEEFLSTWTRLAQAVKK